MKGLAFLIVCALALTGCTTPATPTKQGEATTTPQPTETIDTTTSQEPLVESIDHPATAPNTDTQEEANNQTVDSILNGTLRVVDVGQGSAAIVDLDGAIIVYDTANRFSANYQPLLDALNDMGVTRIDHFVISHPDADHSGGCEHVFAAFEVDQFYHPGYNHDTQTWQRCLDAAQAEGSDIWTESELADDPTLRMAGGLGLSNRILHMDADASDPNAASLSLRIDFGETSMILVGDTDCTVESKILATSIDVDVDILEVGHHGSKTGTCTAWLEATTPLYAYISAGANNTYGHPSQEDRKSVV